MNYKKKIILCGLLNSLLFTGGHKLCLMAAFSTSDYCSVFFPFLARCREATTGEAIGIILRTKTKT